MILDAGATAIQDCKNWDVIFYPYIYYMTNLLNTDENMKISNAESHVMLLHFASNKKLMQIETFIYLLNQC